MSIDLIDSIPPRTFARLTGAAYLAFISTAVLADVLGRVGLGEPAHILEAIAADPGRFRAAIMTAFVSAFLFLTAAWGLYVLLRPVDRTLALLFLLLNAIGVAVQCASMLQLISALLASTASEGLPAFTETQTAAFALHAIEVYRAGLVSAQLFFGTWLFPLGVLVLRSGFLPAPLGVLLIVDGAAVTGWFLTAFLFPDAPAIQIPLGIVSLVAELGLALWLLIGGVKTARRAVGSAPAA